MELHYGVNKTLEEEANELIRESLVGVTSMAAKSDILTPWKEENRRGREVYNAEGIADPAVRKGIYGRAWNREQTHLNSRDGHYPPAKEQHRDTTPFPALESYLFDE